MKEKKKKTKKSANLQALKTSRPTEVNFIAHPHSGLRVVKEDFKLITIFFHQRSNTANKEFKNSL